MPQERNKKIIFYTILISGVLGIVAPFIHVFYLNSGVKGLFGFQEMESFLFAIGFPILSMSSGILFFYASKNLIETNLKVAYGLFSSIFFYIGVFFLTWALIPTITDFEAIWYYGSLAIIPIISVICFRFILNYISENENKIGILVELIGSIRVNHIFKMTKKVDELKDQPDKLCQEMKENANEFDSEVFITFKKISNKPL